MNVTGDVFGWFTVAADTKSCDYSTWGSAARQAATTAGIDLSAYTNVVHAFPRQSACWWSGLANLPGRYSWVNGDMVLYVASHELGHNFGVDHAASLTCTKGGVRVSYSSNCTADEYGDPFDPMGYTGQRHMNTWHRYELGFLGKADLQTVTTDGTYRVAPAEIAGGAPRLLRVQRPGGDYYYVEYRQPYGLFDNFVAGSSPVSGVMLRIAPDTEIVRSKLIDAVPSTATFTDAALAVGNTFTDPINSIYITVLSTDPSGADVSVTFGPDLVPPSAPGNLTAGTDSTGTITLTWTDATDNVAVTGYDISRDGTFIGSVRGTSFSDPGLPQATTYRYTVVAHDKSNSGPAATATVYLPDTTAPEAPTTLLATASGPNAVALSWSPATDNVGVANYRVGRNGILLGTVTETTFADTAVVQGELNRYRVRPVDAAGNVGVGTEIYYTLDLAGPSLGAPLTATFDPASPNRVSLDWPDGSDNVGVAKYVVTRNGASVAETTTSAWRDNNVKPAHSYAYSVQAFDAAGNSSGVLTASIYVPDVTAPTSPGSVVAALASPTTAVLAWSASTDDVAVDHYVVTRNGVEVARPAAAGTLSITVVEGRTYQFAVAAADTAGNTSPPATASLLVPDVTPPSSVGALTASVSGAGTVTLNWTAASDNVAVGSYVVARDGVNLATLPATSLSYVDQALAPDLPYSYSVTPVDAAGNAGPPSTASVTVKSADTVAPTVPANVRGEQLGSRRVDVMWDPSTDNWPGPIKYKIYRDGVRLATVKSVTSYVDRPSKVGTYSYRVRAIDMAGNWSALSTRYSIYAAR